MASSSPARTPQFLDSDRLRHHAYSRKQKSLGLLCSNFVSVYNRDGVETVGLDDAARRLGVERRRIYDIVNVMESVGVLRRKAKNRYSWIGFQGIPKALEELKEEGLREIPIAGNANEKMVLYDDEDDAPDKNEDDGEEKLSQTFSSSSSAAGKPRSAMDNRREKSLGLLTQNFVKLFLTTNVDTVSLDEAARVLLGDINDASHMRTKVRRLYDIANVLSSMNLIEKIQVEARKPAFRWLGTSGKPREDTGVTVAIPPTSKQPNKRAFGTELTNVELKRSKLNYAMVDKKPSKLKLGCDDIKECNQTAQKQSGSNNGYVFGPFRPVVMNQRCDVIDEKGGKRVQDWESLAYSFRPQYHNQALNDLFAHYMEAWKSWYVEVNQGSRMPTMTLEKVSR